MNDGMTQRGLVSLGAALNARWTDRTGELFSATVFEVPPVPPVPLDRGGQ